MRGSSFRLATVLCGLLIGLTSGAAAAPILSATGATINSGGPGFGSITNTFNQAGLSVGYTSGVTDFGTYLAGNPTHTDEFPCCEWFSNQGTSSASVTYNLGSVQVVDALALWNEEASGIGVLDLFSSADGVSFAPLASGLVPTDNGPGSYLADVFSFGAVSAQFIRFDMSGCPQPIGGSGGTFAACAIGEVAFQQGVVNGVPEPGTLAIVGLGLAALAFVRRRVKA